MKKTFLVALAMVVLVLAAAVAGCGSHATPAQPVVEQPPTPHLVSLAPVDGAAVTRDVTVMLSFDAPMDAESLARSATFDPAIPFDVVESGEQVEIRPVSLLAGATTYRFTLNAGAALSEKGVRLETGATCSFTTSSDAVALTIPRFGFLSSIVEGTNADEIVAAIGNGVGHYPGAGRPGAGNFVLFAHASGQVSFPYNRLFEMSPGDEMILEYAGKSYTYRMTKGFVVNQTELWILEATQQPMITFFICSAAEGVPSPTFHPEYRYVVRADLITSNN